MWAVLLANLGKVLLPVAEKTAQVALPLIWQALVKAGYITSTEAALLKAGTHVLQVVQSVQVDPTYPSEGATEGTPNNLANGG
jgi:hypothetical protein